MATDAHKDCSNFHPRNFLVGLGEDSGMAGSLIYLLPCLFLITYNAQLVFDYIGANHLAAVFDLDSESFD